MTVLAQHVHVYVCMCTYVCVSIGVVDEEKEVILFKKHLSFLKTEPKMMREVSRWVVM